MVPSRLIRGHYESSERWFDVWFTKRLNESNMTMTEVANNLMISHQSIRTYKNGYQKPTFVTVVALCWLFGMKDDPYEVYSYAERDWP